MCGIVGFTGSNNRRVLLKMMAKVHHRGVDDAAIFEGDGVSSGIKRLAINDLRKNLYPLISDNKRLVLVFNGEIYNYEELKKELGKEACRLKTKVDAEILLLLYEKYQEKCLEYLDGMFAFALYDKKRKIIFCARDRFGEKPFYYSNRHGVFIFGSEAKSLLPHPLISKNINGQALFYYLRFGFIPFDLSIFKDIKKLPAGHYLIWGIKDKKIRIRKYWDLNFTEKLPEIKIENAVDQIEQRLLTSVKRRLLSDVPIGIFLSGGLDSSLVAAMIKKFINKPIPSFSVRIPGKKYNESLKASQVAKFLKTKPFVIDFTAKDVFKILPKISKIFDEPISDPAALPTFKMCRSAKKIIKVVFTGEGADELFGGYEWYRKELNFHKKWNWIPKIISNNYREIVPYRILRIFSKLPVYYFSQQRFSLIKTKQILKKRYWRRINFKDPFLRFKNKKFGNRLLELMLYTDIKSLLVDQLLVKVDRTTMVNNLEARTPFLSKDVAEYAASLPSSFKITKRFQNKYILRKVAEKYLPVGFCRQKKHPFLLPLNEWLRGPLGILLDDLVNWTLKNRSPLNHMPIKDLVNSHRQGKNHGDRLWVLISLKHWLENLE
jgi:asparagine synthase (glutamine-hydrolysing)